MDRFHYGARPEVFYNARQNRKSATAAEKLVWSHVRNRKLDGFKFRRQHPIATFIADFYCHDCAFVVEIDGDCHDEDERRYNEASTAGLVGMGLTVIRFNNQEVFSNLNQVLIKIRKHLIPVPSPPGEGW